MRDCYELTHPDAADALPAGAACLSFGAAFWKRIEVFAATNQLSVSSVAVTGVAAVLERIADAPVPLWCISKRSSSRNDLAPGFLLTLAAEGRSFLAAARHSMDRSRAVADTSAEAATWLCVLDGADQGAAGADPIRHANGCGGPAAASVSVLPRVVLRPPGDGADGALVIDGDPAILPAERAATLAQAWFHLMQAALDDPDSMLDALPVAAAFDRATAWPAVAPPASCALADDPPDMAGLFEAILDRWPAAPAIVWPQDRLTFAQVDRAAAAIAALLRDRGIVPTDTIAVRIAGDAPPGSTVLYLCAQIAAFRLGCAVMPLGQQVPSAQAWAQVMRVGARFILSATSAPASPPAWPQDAARDGVPSFPHAALFTRPAFVRRAACATSDLPAVILTSSGTTGTPKTTCLSQAMILAFLRGLQATGTFVPCPALINANIGFDIILSDLWIPWMHGHHVIVLETDRRSPAVLATARDLGARFTSFSPSIATALLNDDPHCLAPFHGLHVAGEALPLALARRFESLAPATRVVNGYGPSETAPLTTVWPVHTEGEDSIPLGHALPGYRVLVADRNLRPLPAHWPGELLIAPAAPALGYHDPAMSAGAFVEIPHEAPGPFFRSGDFGWIDRLGRVRFIGRRDRQLKLRGVRVELNGVEHRILTVSGVADVAVIHATGPDSAGGLLAVVQPDAGSADDTALAERIIAACQAWLPRAAVPGRVVFVETMPKGPSGKKAYRALAERFGGHATAGSSRTAPPPDSVEARLAVLWQDFLAARGLRADVLCVEDDVFVCGASSLDALTMAERIETIFGIKVPDDQMFLHTTIGAQAAMIRAAPLAAPAVERNRLALRLLRPADAAEPSRGAIVGLPGLAGNAPFIGRVAAEALHGFDIWSMTVDLGGRDLLQRNAWLDCARLIADRLQADGAPVPKAMVGFSLGGFLGWLVDRLLAASGRGGIPVVNLDGDVPDAELPDWRHVAAPLLPDPAMVPATRMLLLRRAKLPRFITRLSQQNTWSALGVAITTRCLGTVSHLDFNRPPAILAEADAMETFAETGTCPSVADDRAPVLDTPGGTLFRLLRRWDLVTPDDVAAFVGALPPGAVEDDLRLGLTFLSLAAGDPGQADSVISRLVAEAPDIRNEAYARIALLAQTRRLLEALLAARDWTRNHPDDQAMFARAKRWTPPAQDPAGVERLFTDGPEGAIDVAASRLRPADANDVATAGKPVQR